MLIEDEALPVRYKLSCFEIIYFYILSYDRLAGVAKE